MISLVSSVRQKEERKSSMVQFCFSKFSLIFLINFMNSYKLEGAETKVKFVKGCFQVRTKFELQLTQRRVKFCFHCVNQHGWNILMSASLDTSSASLVYNSFPCLIN